MSKIYQPYPKAPCDESLSALPGDRISFKNPDAEHDFGIIQCAKWQQSAKGGRDYVYELTDGTVVSNLSVYRIDRKERPHDNTKDELMKFIGIGRDLSRFQEFFKILEDMELPSTLKTSIHCIMKGDAKNLEVAAFLISDRARQLSDMIQSEIKWPADGSTTTPTNSQEE